MSSSIENEKDQGRSAVDSGSERMRWLWLGGSIVSDRDNPLVPRNRLILRALRAAGQEIEYLEPSDHPAFRERLTDEGSGFYREFQREFPDLRYRRYDMPRSFERDVWLSREAALVDVLVVESGAPSEIFAWLDRVEETTLVRVLERVDGDTADSRFHFSFGGDGSDLPFPAGITFDAESFASQLLTKVGGVRSLEFGRG